MILVVKTQEVLFLFFNKIQKFLFHNVHLIYVHHHIKVVHLQYIQIINKQILLFLLYVALIAKQIQKDNLNMYGSLRKKKLLAIYTIHPLYQTLEMKIPMQSSFILHMI